jgi:shikimate dehydrogenase
MARFAVVGDPILYSKSPRMHTAAYRALGLDHTYEAIRATAAELPAVVARLRAGEIAGLNVTVPHKERVLDLADDVAPIARAAAAANTLVRDPAGRIVAYNTDVPALADELRTLAPRERPWPRGCAIVLGAGGAAKAAVVALRASLHVANVVVLARRGGAPLAPDRAREARAAIVVQATSCGMRGADPGEIVADAIAWGALPDDAVALDLVYTPPETPFLAAARKRGLVATNGEGMLVRQGALSFELWLGVAPPLEVMRSALRA